VRSADFSAMLHYMGKSGGDFGIMVTKSAFDVKKIGGRRILQVPLSIFLSANSLDALLKA
jgi:hypothetical protein